MIKPLVYELTLSEVNATKMVGEPISVLIGGSSEGVDAMLIKKEGKQGTVCTDYYDRVCGDCERTSCYFNSRNGDRRI